MNSDNETFKLREQRLEKLKNLEEIFQIDPYIINFKDSNTNSKIIWQDFKKNRLLSQNFHEKFNKLENSECSEELIWVSGRIHSSRNSAMFLDIYDDKGKIQIVTERNELSPDYSKEDLHFLDLLDKGDIIAVQGFPYRTPRGELSLKSKEIFILSKAIQPPPEIIENKRRRLGLTDLEVRYRQRYLDLMVNHEVKEVFKKRSEIFWNLRNILHEKDFMEFETPVLQTEAGGANARPFITHHNALGMDLYLRIATELHLKRLLVGGFEKIYEIGRIFRNEGISTRHNPEFTSIEIYQAFADYEDVLNLTEELISKLNEKCNACEKITWEKQEINLARPWKKITMLDLVEQITGKRFENCNLEQAKLWAKEIGLNTDDVKSIGEILILCFEERCEKTLIQPTFVLSYPWENSPLAGNSPEEDLLPVSNYSKDNLPKAQYAHRFELFIGGKEIANGFTEQNDPRRQKAAFERQNKLKEQGDLEAHPIDHDFITALEFAMPPAGGVGIGIDRLLMLLTNSDSIRDVILFPTMKPIN